MGGTFLPFLQSFFLESHTETFFKKMGYTGMTSKI